MAYPTLLSISAFQKSQPVISEEALAEMQGNDVSSTTMLSRPKKQSMQLSLILFCFVSVVLKFYRQKEDNKN